MSFRVLRSLLVSMVCVSLGAACSSAPVPVEEEAEDRRSNSDDSSDSSAAPSSSGKPTKPSSNSSTSVSPSPSNSGDPSEPVGPTKPGGNGDEPIPVPDGHVPDIDPDFPGIDVAIVGETAPSGCTSGGHQIRYHAFVINLSNVVPGVRLHVEDGVLHANGHGCRNESGEPMLVEDLRQLHVNGGPEANLVILDFADSDFGSQLFQEEGGFRFDGGLGDEVDALYIRGSRGDDEFYAGAANSRFVAALSSTARVNLFAKSFEQVRVSLGPGDDTWAEIGRLNVGLFDLDGKTPLNIKGIDVPQRIWGGDGNDELFGGAFDDLIVGGYGDDILNGRAGNDRFEELSQQNGRDTINGGPGLDEVNYGLRSRNLVVELCTSEAQAGCDEKCDCSPVSGEDGEEDTIVNVEIARTGSGDDTLRGSPGDDYLYGGEGDDRLFGGAGSDVLQGGEGDDEFDGGDDEDICDADPGEIVLSCEV